MPAESADQNPTLTRSALPTQARFALGAVLPAVVIVATIIITTGGSSHHPQGPPPPRPPPARLPALVQTFASPAIGVGGQIPRDWSAVRGPGFVRLANRDRSAEILLAAQAITPGAKLPLLSQAVASIRKTYGTVITKRAPGTRLGGLPARSLVVYTRNQHRVPIRVLVAVARGRHLAYIVEAFNAQRAPLHDLVESQQIVLELRLAG